MDSTLLPFALLCFTSFFTLTNPLGTMPVFLTMTHGMTDKERQTIVRRATIVSFITLMVFVFAGQFLFKFFGISTNGFRIAGGVIIFKIGFDMPMTSPLLLLEFRCCVVPGLSLTPSF